MVPIEVWTCAALLAAMLLSLAVASSDLRSRLGLADLAARPDAPPAPAPAATPVAPVAAVAPVAPIQIHVNARPWARVRVDGFDAGPTPLGHLRVAPGVHEFEATFADGRVVRRQIEIGPDQRFVMLR